jgi:hypothetical protein
MAWICYLRTGRAGRKENIGEQEADARLLSFLGLTPAVSKPKKRYPVPYMFA